MINIKHTVEELRKRIENTTIEKEDKQTLDLVQLITDKLVSATSLKTALMYDYRNLTDEQFARVVRYFIKDDILIERKVETWTSTDFMDRDFTETSYRIIITVLSGL